MLSTLLVTYGAVLLQGVVAAVPHLAPALNARDCPHDNCLRAVIASAFMTRSATADCSSYFLTTVTPPATTTTITVATVTSLIAKRDNGAMIIPRQETVAPSKIPAYASACSGSVRYSSACSCIGVTAMTTTAPTPTSTETVTSTTVEVSAPTLDNSQYFEFGCSSTDPLITPTTLTLNTCVLTDISFSDKFGAFIGGACTPAECSVNFYGPDTINCSDPPTRVGVAVTDTSCFDFSSVGAAMLICPTCPQA